MNSNKLNRIAGLVDKSPYFSEHAESTCNIHGTLIVFAKSVPLRMGNKRLRASWSYIPLNVLFPLLNKVLYQSS